MSRTILLLILFFIKTGYSKRPNVLFVIVDDLRPSLKCYGDENSYTPNIDKLASKSFLFRNTFAQQAICGPSRSSFLTSRRPDTLHIYVNEYNYWRSTVGNFTTLPQHFKQNGYYTYSIGKVFHPGRLSNFTDDYPYSWSKKPFHPKTDSFKNAKVCVGKDGKLARNLICPVIPENQPGGTLPDLESLNEAVQFLKYRNNTTDKPYFLAVGFHKPHVPLKFPIQYLVMSIRTISSAVKNLLSNPVQDVTAKKVLEVSLNGSYARINYEVINGNTYDLIHTTIPPKYHGQGLGTQFAHKIFDYLVDRNMKFKTTCEFLVKVCNESDAKYKDYRVN